MEGLTALHVGASAYLARVCKKLGIAETVNRLVRWDEKQWKHAPGTFVVALVVNILMQRRPLYRVSEFYRHLDLPVLFGPDVEADDLHDDAFGRTLDRLYESEQLKLLIHSTALRAVDDLPLGIRSVHSDTTSISLEGRYDPTVSDARFSDENPDRHVLDITHGYSKDHRPDLKQFIYGLVVSGEGLPLLANVHDGNQNDKHWNREMLDEIQESFLEPHKLVYIADSALVTSENLEKMAHQKVRFISRLPETFGLAEELKARAWSQKNWEQIGRLAQSAKGAVYQAQSFVAALDDRTYRFVVVHSSALDKRKVKTLERRIARDADAIGKAQKGLEKQAFECEPDAAAALEAFCKAHGRGLHSVTGRIVAEETIQRPPGRPRKGEAPPTVTHYRVEIKVGDPTDKARDEWMQRANTFVLITTLPEEAWSNTEILQEYKGQAAVETRFRNLKAAPCIVDNIYVKSSRRAEALAYIFILALLVASYIEIKIRQELQRQKRKFLVPGGRWTDRPTMTMLFDVLSTALVLKLIRDGTAERVLPDNTDSRIREILELTGLDDAAYTEVIPIGP